MKTENNPEAIIAAKLLVEAAAIVAAGTTASNPTPVATPANMVAASTTTGPVTGVTFGKPNDPRVANTDENLSLPVIYQQTGFPSVAQQMLPTVDLHGPTGALFNLKKKDTKDELEMVRSEVEIYATNPIKTGITQEAYEDLWNQFGISGSRAISAMLHSIANVQENEQFAKEIEKIALTGTPVTVKLNATHAAGDQCTDVFRAVNASIAKMNLNGFRTMKAVVMVPFELAGLLMCSNILNRPNAASVGQSSALSSQSCSTTAQSGFIGHLGTADYYINPDITAKDVYVVLSDKCNPSASAVIFSPYSNIITATRDYEKGDLVYFIMNRFAFGVSPLNKGNPMVTKITVS